MLKNEVTVTIVKTDSGRIRIGMGGGSYLVPEMEFGLIAGLEVELLHSLGILDKMDFKLGDRVIVGESAGIVTKICPTEIDVEVRMDDDLKKLFVNRKDLNYEN